MPKSPQRLSPEECRRILEEAHKRMDELEEARRAACARGEHGLFSRFVRYGRGDIMYWRCPHCNTVFETRDKHR